MTTYTGWFFWYKLKLRIEPPTWLSIVWKQRKQKIFLKVKWKGSNLVQITVNVSASFCVSAEPSGVFSQRLRQFLWRRLWGEGGGSVPLSFCWGWVLEDQSDGSAGQCGFNIVWQPAQVYLMCCRVRLWRCPAVGKSYFRVYFTGLRYCCFNLKSKCQMF